MKYIIATLGCKVNQYESEAMEQLLRARGHERSEKGGAELVIVNSSTAELDNVLTQLGDSRDVLVLDSASSDSAFVQIENFLKESG